MIHGEVADGFVDVRKAFARGFGELGETGAGYVAIVDGRVVVDL